MNNIAWVILAGLLVPGGAWAKDIRLAWEFDQSVAGLPAAWAFTIVSVYQGVAGQRQVNLMHVDASTCKQWEPQASSDTFCAALPCPGPGAHQLLLQAENSQPSNLVELGIAPGGECQQIPFVEAMGKQPIVVGAPPVQEPTPTEIPLESVGSIDPGVPVPQLKEGTPVGVSLPVTVAETPEEPEEMPTEEGQTNMLPENQATLEEIERNRWTEYQPRFAELQAAYLAELEQIRNEYEAQLDELLQQRRGRRSVGRLYREANAQYQRAIRQAQHAWVRLRNAYYSREEHR